VLNRRSQNQNKLDCLAAVRQFFEDRFSTCDPVLETLWVAHLDNARNCLFAEAYLGDGAHVEMPTRLIVCNIIRLNSTGIILAHNHPSGDARPSQSDCRSTRRLAVVAEAIDCSVLDHLVFGGNDCTSLREQGFL
jgi:DNA repair protein RadC